MFGEKQNIEETASGQDVTGKPVRIRPAFIIGKKGNTQAFGEFYRKNQGTGIWVCLPHAAAGPGCGGGGPGNISEDMERGGVL